MQKLPTLDWLYKQRAELERALSMTDEQREQWIERKVAELNGHIATKEDAIALKDPIGAELTINTIRERNGVGELYVPKVGAPTGSTQDDIKRRREKARLKEALKTASPTEAKDIKNLLALL